MHLYALIYTIFWLRSVQSHSERAIGSTYNDTYESQDVIPLGNDSLDIYVSCKNVPCIRKCCPDDHVLLNGCTPFNASKEEDIFTLFDVQRSNFTVIHSFPEKPNPKIICVKHSSEDVRISDSGDIILKRRQLVIHHDNYCIDWEVGETGTLEGVAGLCYEPILKDNFHKITNQVQIGGHLASCSFTFVLIVMHSVSKKLRSSFHGKCFLSMCVAFFLGFLFLVFIITPVVEYFDKTTCQLFAFLTQYFMLSFWIWLTVRCYETWRVVRGTIKAIPLQVLNSEKNRFLKYSLVSWGSPLVVTIFTLAMQLCESLPREIHPGIGEGRCWIKESFIPLTIYYYGYQVPLHILNIMFIMSCVYLLWTTGEAFQWVCRSKEERLVPHNKKSLRMFWQQFYIFLLYIVLFSMDSISLIDSKKRFWKIFDIVNSLQGLFLFIIFSLSNRKRNIFSLMWSRTSSLAKTLSTKLVPMRSSSARSECQKEDKEEKV